MITYMKYAYMYEYTSDILWISNSSDYDPPPLYPHPLKKNNYIKTVKNQTKEQNTNLSLTDMGSLEEVLNGLDDMVGLLALKQEREKMKHEKYVILNSGLLTAKTRQVHF